MTSVLPSRELVAPSGGSYEVDPLMSYDDELRMRDVHHRAAAAARRDLRHMDSVTFTFLQGNAMATAEAAFKTERAGWLLAKEAVRVGFEESGDPQEFITSQDGTEEVKQKAAGFVGAAIDAYVLKHTETT